MSTDTTTANKISKTPASSPNTRCPVSLRLPPAFKALCDRDGMTMAQLLQSFAADLCGLAPLTRKTRYVSRGQDAQNAARAYYEAAGFGRRDARQEDER
jgi:hypothetical protein